TVTPGQIMRATLSKGVRAWNEQDARQVADKIHLVVNQNADSVTISTNRDQFNQQFSTNIQLEVPASVLLTITGSYGTINATGTRGPLAIKSSYGSAIVSNVAGDLSFDLAYSDITASNIDGN